MKPQELKKLISDIDEKINGIPIFGNAGLLSYDRSYANYLLERVKEISGTNNLDQIEEDAAGEMINQIKVELVAMLKILVERSITGDVVAAISEILAPTIEGESKVQYDNYISGKKAMSFISQMFDPTPENPLNNYFNLSEVISQTGEVEVNKAYDLAYDQLGIKGQKAQYIELRQLELVP